MTGSRSTGGSGTGPGRTGSVDLGPLDLGPLEIGGWSLDLGVERPVDGRVLAAALVAGVAMDAAVRSGVVGLGGAIGLAVLAAGLELSGRTARPTTAPGGVGVPAFGEEPGSGPRRGQGHEALVGTSVLFAACLALRTSPWLVGPDLLAAAGLLVIGASLAGGGHLIDLSVPALVARAVHAAAHGLAAPAFLLRSRLGSSRPGAGAAATALRAVALAVALVLPLGLLLASADTVFASFFGGLDVGALAEHGVLLTVGAWGMAGLLRVASARPPAPLPAPARRLPALEATVAVGGLVGLFTAFAVAQLVALTAGGRHVIETAGLTYAEYARSGFFQLLAVAAITLCALLGLRAVTDLSEPSVRARFVVLAEVAVLLTLLIVFVAVRRLELYEHAFGMTMLRLYSEVFAAWTGAVFVLLALVLAGVGAGRQWLPSAAVGLGLAVVLVLNALNPEAFVVRHNVDRAATTGRFDVAYALSLSDDAVPALVDALPRLGPDDRHLVLETLCRPEPGPFRGWLAYNGARHAADAARDAACSRP